MNETPAEPKPNRLERRRQASTHRSAKWQRLVNASTRAAMKKHNEQNARMLALLDKYGDPRD